MATSFDTLIDRFLRRIEEDSDFFNYYNLTAEQSAAIASSRAENYLHEAIGLFILKAHPDVDFTDYNLETRQFNFELSVSEIFLISALMYEMYLDRDISKIKLTSANYTPTNLRVFDPSGARTSFMQMYQHVCHTNDLLLDDYKSSDRETGAYKTVKYADYNG